MTERRLRELHVDEKDLAQTLVMMAKTDGIVILQAELEGYRSNEHYRVYYEADADAYKLLRIHCENSILWGKIDWFTEKGDRYGY